MAQATKGAVADRIEIVDQPEELTERTGSRLKIIIPAVVVAALTAFVVVRRIRGSKED